MHFLVLFFIMIFSLKAWSFEYQVDSGSLTQSFFIQRQQLSKIFEKSGFTSMNDRSLTSTGLPFDSLFVVDGWSKALLLKAGLKAPSSIEGRILEDPVSGVSAVHFQFQGTPYLLVAVNLSRDELQKVMKPLLKRKYSLFRLFVPLAHAAEICRSPTQAWSKFQETLHHIESQAILKSIGHCGLDALWGAKQSATGTFSFFQNLATNPIALWNEMKKSFEAMKQFTLNLQAEMQQIFATLGYLSTEQKVQIACTMTGEILTGVLMGGAVGSLPRLAPTITLKIKTAGKVLAKIMSLEKKGFVLPNRSFLTREALSCAK